MPAKAPKVSKLGGPFLAAAVFCEGILEDKGGAVSALKIVDGCHIELSADAPSEFPSRNHPLPISQKALITFRTGGAPGNHIVKLVLENPEGNRFDGGSRDVTFASAPNGGANICTTAVFPAHETGLFWVDVYLDSKLATRMPFKVTIDRMKSNVATRPKKGVVKTKT